MPLVGLGITKYNLLIVLADMLSDNIKYKDL